MDNEKEGFPITAIREIKILKILNHKNVVKLEEIVTSKAADYNQGKGAIYMVLEFCDHDLTGLTDGGQRFTTAQIKCFMKQLLQGLAYCHKNHILHRDIKGSNLLINDDGQLKLADFGLARPFDENNKPYTNRVITLWYRPPELLLGETKYGSSIDMWSAGCIFAELLMRKPILTGRAELQQLTAIFSMFGTPTEASWPGVASLPHYASVVSGQLAGKQLHSRFDAIFVELDPCAKDLLKKMLSMDPASRISAKDALDHDYFWTNPMPDKPEDLPKYRSSHEFTAKKRRHEAQKQQQAQQQAQPQQQPPPPQQQQQQQQQHPPHQHQPPPQQHYHPPQQQQHFQPQHHPQSAYQRGPPPNRGPPQRMSQPPAAMPHGAQNGPPSAYGRGPPGYKAPGGNAQYQAPGAWPRN